LDRPLFSFVTGVLCRHRHGEPAPSGCDDFRGLPVHSNGVTFYLRPRTGTFRHLRERPQADPPGAEPLIPLSIFIPVPRNVGRGPDEEFIFGRLQTSDAQPTLVSTDRGWLIAACDRDPASHVGHCRIGFLIQGLSVEAHYSTGSPVDATQHGIWRVATAVDRKLRTLIRR
jgi:hypothetical protein